MSEFGDHLPTGLEVVPTKAEWRRMVELGPRDGENLVAITFDAIGRNGNKLHNHEPLLLSLENAILLRDMLSESIERLQEAQNSESDFDP